MNEKYSKKLEMFMKFVEDGAVSKEEFSAFLKELAKELLDMESGLKTEILTVDEKYQTAYKEIEVILSDIKTMIKDSNIKSLDYTKERFTLLLEKFNSVIKDIKDSIPTMPDLSDINTKINNLDSKIKVIEDKKPEEIKPTFVNDLLEPIKEELKNLRKYVDTQFSKVKKSGGKTMYVGGGNAGGGRIVKSYDIYDSLNGVTKTFSLPAFYRIISVHSSSFPFSFRETVDYTSDASAMTITFTSEISASVTLATGQTVTIVYSEA